MVIKIFVVFILVLAFLGGVITAYFPLKILWLFSGFSDLFYAMIPILAAGALVKYLVYNTNNRSIMGIKIFVGIVLAFACFAGLVAAYFSPIHLYHLTWLRDFIDSALPILATGALIKYLVSIKIGLIR